MANFDALWPKCAIRWRNALISLYNESIGFALLPGALDRCSNRTNLGPYLVFTKLFAKSTMFSTTSLEIKLFSANMRFGLLVASSHTSTVTSLNLVESLVACNRSLYYAHVNIVLLSGCSNVFISVSCGKDFI